jgi:ATP-dependent Lon protease
VTRSRAAAGQGVPQGRHPRSRPRRRAGGQRPATARVPGRATAASPRQPQAPTCPASPPGLAVTGLGGDVLLLRDVGVGGQEGLTVTGHARDVMKESASIALSWVGRPRTSSGIDPGASRAVDPRPLPGGRDPQGRPVRRRDDGDRPRFLLTGRPVRSDVGMTGEVTLIGTGAADRRREAEACSPPSAPGLSTVVRARAHRADLDDVPCRAAQASSLRSSRSGG